MNSYWCELAWLGGERVEAGVLLEVEDDRIAGVSPGTAAPPAGAERLPGLTIPGLVYDARKFVNTARGKSVQYYLPHPDAAALSWVAEHAPAGGVLAPTPFAALVPSQSGRNVWAGHGYWSRDYPARAAQVNRLFRGRMRPAAAQAFVNATGAKLLISDCTHHADVGRTLGPLLGSVHRFGCATVYVLTRSASR